MTRSRFIAALLAIVALATLLRTIYPAADPPWRSTVGVVWHDEGAWTHNARNKALFGAWRQDEWNPVYIAPVFTALEYASFSVFGVGVRQARLVSEIAGVVSVLLLALGVRRIAGPFAGAIAGALLATNFVYVMYDRAAIMEALMVAFIVASWYCSTRAEERPLWGALAGVCATLAFFTKASAAFYIGALGILFISRVLRRKVTLPADRLRHGYGESAEALRAKAEAGRYLPVRHEARPPAWTIGGLAVSAGLIGVFFVLPHWSDYQFYNWQMSVTRKPSYDVVSIVNRFTQFPILHDTFSRMWLALLLGVLGAWGVVVRWKDASDGERLLVLWIAVGAAELLVHDVGNERRFVFFIPALVALASVVLTRGAAMPEEFARIPLNRALIVAPLVLYADYVVWGALVRVLFLDEIYVGVLRLPVRSAALAAAVFIGIMFLRWDRVRRDWTRVMWGTRTAVAITALAVCWNFYQFAAWAGARTYENYQASRTLGDTLPAGTLVQGKLANGLALENRIRPIFIGHQFGNYADRKARWDVRYILTYTDPAIGYEGDQILDVLAAYPGWRTIMTFDVAETPSGHDKAALIEKRAGH